MNIVQIYQKFPTDEDCICRLEDVRWKGKPTCPYCASDRVSANEHRHHCNNCNTSFSVTVNTIFHHTHLPLQKWFLAISLILNAKKGLSARQLARDLEVNKNTAWYMGMRIRNAMFEQGELMRGIVEMDETYIGGKPRKGNDHSSGPKGGTHKRGRGTSKIPVVGIMERDGKVVARPVDKSKLNYKGLSKLVREHVDLDEAILITDEYSAYHPMRKFVIHAVINHRYSYADGEIHTNSIEGFWGLLKRGIVGQYHKVTLRHLHQYVTEFCYRYNYRNHPCLFDMTLNRAVGVNA
jgi:transposase-like protein